MVLNEVVCIKVDNSKLEGKLSSLGRHFVNLLPVVAQNGLV